MIPLDEFYDFSAQKQWDLVDRGHVVIDGQLADELPPRSATEVYVFEEPVIDQIVTLLKQGRYKVSEIAPEFPLNRDALDDVISDLRYNRLDTLSNYNAVVRAAGKDGAANIYTVGPLPFQVRTVDPTLSGHLIVATDLFYGEEPTTEVVPSSSGYDAYATRVKDYWDLPESELEREVNTDTQFVNSALGPLPVPTAYPDADTVRDRVMDVDEAYSHKQYTRRKVHHGIMLRKSRTRRNPSLPSFQEFASYLADVYRYAALENETELRDLTRRGADVYFQCLYGNFQVSDSAGWRPFEATDRSSNLKELDHQVLDVFERQPTKNKQLAARWGFEDTSQISHYIRTDFEPFATRNADKFICATETARRRVNQLLEDGLISTTKQPPEIPIDVETPIERPNAKSKGTPTRLSDASTGSDDDQGTRSGVDWTKM